MALAVKEPGAPLLRAFAEAALRPYAGVVFSRDLRSGALVLLAVLLFPRVAAATALSVVVAAAATLGFGLGVGAVRDGRFACSAVLTTLAITAYSPGGERVLPLIVAGAALAVLFTASFEAVFLPVALPTHSLPFVAATWTVSLAARSLPFGDPGPPWTEPLSFLPPALVYGDTWLSVPANLLFLHGAAAGALVFVAIALHSRISLLLGVVGAVTAIAMRAVLRGGAPESALDTTASFNAVLSAIALGSVWFIPSPASIALGAAAAAASVVITHALFPLLGVAYLPVVSLPFVVTTHLFLAAARRRERDRAPRSALPAERPEEALARELGRARRFGDVAWLPFRLPFRGEWRVTQGHDGAHTHRGLWRHGLDFEVFGADGHAFEGAGTELRSYRCYGLPVLAAGAGTVTQVIDGIADNRVGEMNARDNWGNAVVIQHGLGLYTAYAHLQPRSTRIKVGDVVAAGAEIGRCGNSGRSPAPHLHFQAQTGPTLGSPTLTADIGDVVTSEGEHDVLAIRTVPREGAAVRPIVRDEATARALDFPVGGALLLRRRETAVTERAEISVDLAGRTVLSSPLARLYVERYEAGLVMLDFEGDARSMLRYLLVSLSRLPFDQSPHLAFREDLPLRLLLPGWARALADLLAVVAPSLGATRVDYTTSREGSTLTISGRAVDWSSEARLHLGGEAHVLEVTYRGRRATVDVSIVPAGEEEKGPEGPHQEEKT